MYIDPYNGANLVILFTILVVVKRGLELIVEHFYHKYLNPPQPVYMVMDHYATQELHDPVWMGDDGIWEPSEEFRREYTARLIGEENPELVEVEEGENTDDTATSQPIE